MARLMRLMDKGVIIKTIMVLCLITGMETGMSF